MSDQENEPSSQRESLPVVKPTPRKRVSKSRSIAMHIGRLLMVFALASALHQAEAKRRQTAVESQASVRLDLDTVLRLFPDALSVSEADNEGIHLVQHESGDEKRVISSRPQSDKVIGYRGTSTSMISLDANDQVQQVLLLESADTPEHAEAVLKDADFFAQFQAWQYGKVNPIWEVDGVSGATLTSLAVAEGIALRLEGASGSKQRTSLRFAEALKPADLDDTWFEGSATIKAFGTETISTEEEPTGEQDDSLERMLVSSSGEVVGRLIRTGPLVDDLLGYQGPSEITIALDSDGRIVGLALRKTFDNEPYVDYVRDEAYFWNLFRGKTLAELEAMDLQTAGVEGVSGATMTSMTVAETLVLAAGKYNQRKRDIVAARRARQQKAQMRWSIKDLGTFGMLAAAILIGMTRLRSIRWLRVCWLVLLVVFLGLTTGNLVSQAILHGWSSSGIAWRLAPGLAAVVCVSLLFPATSKTNLYCSHVCPHGAAQQLVKDRVSWRLKIRGTPLKVLNLVPATLLVSMFAISLLGLGWNLANAEPFNAYIWYVSGTASIVLALGSLMFAAVHPMGYCRYGCPTGSLLDYIRFHGRSGYLSRSDWVCFTLVISSWAYVLIS